VRVSCRRNTFPSPPTIDLTDFQLAKSLCRPCPTRYLAPDLHKSAMPFTDEAFECSCGERLRDKDDVDRHNMRWPELGHSLQCQHPGCGQKSSQTFNAKRHWKTHLPESLSKLSNYFCRKCHTSYTKLAGLKKHEAAPTCLYNRQKRPNRIDELIREQAARLQQLRSMDLSRPLPNCIAPLPVTEATHSKPSDSGHYDDSTWTDPTSTNAFLDIVNIFGIADPLPVPNRPDCRPRIHWPSSPLTTAIATSE
jgi:hypothetical protein